MWFLLISLGFKKNQRRAVKGNERQMETRTKNQNEKQKATKSIFHSHFHSFSPILDLWKVVDIKINEKPERATTGNETQYMKSSKKLRKATTDIGAGKTKTGKKKSRRATKGTKSPNGNQALPTKGHNEQCDAQVETSTKKPNQATESHNEQQKAFDCFGF